MYSIGEASKMLGVSRKTVRRWDAKGKILCFRTVGNHRRIPFQEIARILKNKYPNRLEKLEFFAEKAKHGSHSEEFKKCAAIYARVSTSRQKKSGDLDRQIDYLKKWCEENELNAKQIYGDVGSGLNTRRRGLWRLLKAAKRGKFSRLVVNYKDRLTRFGYEYIEKYLQVFGVKVVAARSLETKTPETELVEDLVSIVHSFSGKLYGLRSHKNS